MRQTVILVTRAGLGHTSDHDAEFGRQMMEKFWHLLERLPEKPRAVCFYTEGVLAARRDGPCQVSLQVLRSLGVRLVACESCLAYYRIPPDGILAEVGGMAEIVELMSRASKVITI